MIVLVLMEIVAAVPEFTMDCTFSVAVAGPVGPIGPVGPVTVDA
jgi:hypothetical protein